MPEKRGTLDMKRIANCAVRRGPLQRFYPKVQHRSLEMPDLSDVDLGGQRNTGKVFMGEM